MTYISGLFNASDLMQPSLLQILHRSVARGVRNFICHQRASPVCKSVFSKVRFVGMLEKITWLQIV